MTEPTTHNGATQVDNLLFSVRWVLLLLVFPIAYFDKGSAPLSLQFWIWVAVFLAFNLIIGILIRFAPRLMPSAGITLALDSLFFGILPYLVESESNALALFVIFPALVGAVRFGPRIGLLTAVILALPIEVRILIPAISHQTPIGWATTFPLVGVIAAVALIGLLALREREAALASSGAELDELRQANDGAHLLYQSIERLSTTSSYEPVLDAMLDAGLQRLPSTRPQEGPPIGITLIFGEGDFARPLQVVASRNLSRRDTGLRIEGKAGVVADALITGGAIVFSDIRSDPELGVFTSLRHCRAGVCYPLQAGLEQYGVVVLASASIRRPAAEYLNLMRAFTYQAAIAFQTAKLYQNLRAEHDQIITSENEIRQKLVRDLHDGPTQKVAAIVMHTEHIGKLIDRDPESAKKEVALARATAEQAVKELRTALFTLRPLTLETQGLSAAIQQLGERWESEHVPITAEPGDFKNDLDANFSATVFSIVEEAVTNARKYSRGAPIHISLSRQNNILVAIVQDSGPGFDLDLVTNRYSEKVSLGLQNMRERSALIDGDLRIETEPGRGTKVTLIVPLPKPASATIQ
jgi:signal transduction histidine kinase